MSTLRITNIEAKADASSPSVNEKIKVVSSTGTTLLQVDGATSGVSTVTVGTGVTIQGDSGIITATKFTGSVSGDVTGNVTGNLSGDIIGTRTLGTGVTVTSAGIVSATNYYGSATHLTSIPGDKITGLIPSSALANVDLASIRRDIAVLSLQNAVDTNRVAYNLKNSFVDQFEDDSGIGAETNVNRKSGEYVITEASTTVSYNFGTAGDHGHPGLIAMNSYNEESSRVWTNDRIDEYHNSGKYLGGVVDFAFDLSNDFDSYVWARVDSSGVTHNSQYQSYSVIISTSTTITSGKAPKLNGTSVWDIDESHWDQHSGSGGFYGGYLSETDVEQSRIFTNATRDHLGQFYYKSTNTGGSNHTLNWSSDGDSYLRSNGLVYGHYFNSGNHSQAHGTRVKYTKSNNTLLIGYATGGGSTGVHADGRMTISNVPTSGRLFHFFGHASGHTSRYNALNTTSGGGSTYSNGSFIGLGIVATGTLISKANTASDARTKVSGVMLYKDGEGTATLGTDIIVSFTCNGGTNWTDLNQASDYSVASDFSTGVKTVYLTEKTCTSGTDVRYKVTWANQAAGSKETQLHGMAINY